jgi:bifunctional non-homologous end joining protein LigD
MSDMSSATRTKLGKYRSKRDFAKTAEPSGDHTHEAAGHSYLIQKHAARRLHYDFRLELGGVLKSWAVTRGPSFNPADKRLAVHVEDHPLDYGTFEGTIPQGQYGGGTVMLWDQGTWEPIGDPKRDYIRGSLTFELHGKRLKGRWHLVRLRGNRAGDGKRENWLLIKGKDEYADTTDGDAALEKYQKSVVSGRSMEGIAKAAGKRSVAAKNAADETTVANVTITHPDRVLWPDGGITKLELAQYYAAIAPKLLAHAGNRPISLVRCPRGPGGQCFFQRHAGEGMASKVHAVNVAGHGDGKPYIFIDDTEGLVSLVQMGTIELHAWNATVSDVKKPDQLIFDLDPGPDVSWQAVKSAAQDLRGGLKKLGLVAFLKTTGGKGLHIVVPFARGPSWAEAKTFARSFSDVLAKAEPDRFTINNRKDVRTGRIFIDYLRNDETSSAVAPYSVRARPGAPVSVPIEWAELARLKAGDAFHIKDVLKRKKAPWAALTKTGKQRLPLGRLNKRR